MYAKRGNENFNSNKMRKRGQARFRDPPHHRGQNGGPKEGSDEVATTGKGRGCERGKEKVHARVADLSRGWLLGQESALSQMWTSSIFVPPSLFFFVFTHSLLPPVFLHQLSFHSSSVTPWPAPSVSPWDARSCWSGPGVLIPVRLCRAPAQQRVLSDSVHSKDSLSVPQWPQRGHEAAAVSQLVPMTGILIVQRKQVNMEHILVVLPQSESPPPASLSKPETGRGESMRRRGNYKVGKLCCHLWELLFEFMHGVPGVIAYT